MEKRKGAAIPVEMTSHLKSFLRGFLRVEPSDPISSDEERRMRSFEEQEADFEIIDEADGDSWFYLKVGIDPDELLTLSESEVLALIGQVALTDTQLRLRLMEILGKSAAKSENGDKLTVEEDEWLTKDQAAKLLNVHPHWLSGKKLPFAKKIGHRTVRYSKVGLLRWQTTRKTV